MGSELSTWQNKENNIMDIAMVGLGKMGANMATRLIRGGHRVVAYDVNEATV